MHMTKVRTTITINKDLLKKARKHEINISSFLDIELRRYLAFIEGKHSNPSQSEMQSSRKNSNDNKLVGPPRFELESLAPKAKRIDQATLRALVFCW